MSGIGQQICRLKYTTVFDEGFTSDGIEVLRSPPQAPRANAYAERWVRTVRRECLDRMLIYHPPHLLAVLAEFVEHYNEHRPHQSRGQRPPDAVDTGPAVVELASMRVRRRRILDGLISETRRQRSPNRISERYRLSITHDRPTLLVTGQS